MGIQNEFQKVTSPQVFDGDNIESIAYDPVYQRLACTSHNGKLKLNRLERDGEPLELGTLNACHEYRRKLVVPLDR